MWLDLRPTLRRLARRPLVGSVAVAALAIGVGANTAVYTVLETVILRPMPLESPERIVRLHQVRAQDPTAILLVSVFASWRPARRAGAIDPWDSLRAD